MPVLARRPVLALAVLLQAAGPSFALTADEVWAEAQRLSREANAEITATGRRQGDRLILTGVAVPLGPAGDRVLLRLDRVDLLEQPDGSVSVVLPPEFPVTLDLEATDPDFDFLVLAASAPGFSLVISGLGETADFALTAPSLAVSLDKVAPAIEVNERLDLNLAVADLAVSHKMDLTAVTKVAESSLRLGTLHGDVLVQVGDGVEFAEMSLDLSGVTGGFSGLVPPSAFAAEQAMSPDANPLPVLLGVLRDGLAMNGALAFDQFALRGSIEEGDTLGTVEVSSESGRAEGRLDATGGGYDVSLGKTVTMTRGMPDLEFSEVAMSVAGIGYGLSFGIGDLTQPQEARLTAHLTDLEISPEVWAKEDPSGVLGSEPLSYALDIAARYSLQPEMLAPGWMPDPARFPPVDLVDVTLSRLMFKGAGIAVEGDGALTFDESDLTTFDGLPAPEGLVSFKATGVNALIERLSSAGMIPDEDLTGLRMGLMFIAKAGADPDSLVSQIEFRDHALFLNGIKLR